MSAPTRSFAAPVHGRTHRSAPTERSGGSRDHPSQRRTVERLRQRMRGTGWESRQRSSPKCPATSDNPSVGLWPTAPFAQGSLALRGTGDADCRVAALLTMTTVFCHSEASAHTGRGNPSFYDGRWTGVRAAVPRAWPPPTKFRTEIWGVGQVVGPYGTKRKPAATARGSALSAERVAGQIRVLPDDLFVQHGVLGSEV